ncbi:MAG: DUF1441 family protein [Marinobacterium sp.]|nr:DUF1441 family protein [Marinobacterium sp.]
MGDTTDAFAWNITKLGEAFGMSRDTVRRRLKAANCKPKFKQRGIAHYALADVGQALYGAHEAAGGICGFESPDHMPPGDRKDWFDSELKRVKLGEAENDLVPAEDMARTCKRI